MELADYLPDYTVSLSTTELAVIKTTTLILPRLTLPTVRAIRAL